MFGLDTLDLLQERNSNPKPRLRRGFLYAACPVVIAAAVIGGAAVARNLASDSSGLVMLLTAIGINVLISVALGCLAYYAGRNRMGW